MQDPVFEPITINRLKLKNRIFMPAMHLGMCVDFKITDQVINFYRERAMGGAGMISTGYATVDEFSGNTQNIGAHSDDFIPGLARLAQTIKEGGARSAVQLNHAGRYNFSFFLNGKQPVAPSAVASRMTRETPRELEIPEIKQIVEAFAQAALRVKKAGFDAVEILSGTGYLISEFLSPLTNKREDIYGGSFENRIRFALEIMEAIKNKTGDDFPLIVRMNGNDFMQDGQGRDELMEYARALNHQGYADAICVNVGWHEARVPQIVAQVPRAAFAYLARGIKKAVDVPVIASHRINDLSTARELIADGMCDMVAMGRSLIADPFLPEKGRSGNEDDILHCVACGQGCFDKLFQLKSVECLCNPRAGNEASTIIQKTEKPKNIIVAGGGPAGMNAALAASEKGHRVTLYERENRLGGQLFLAATPPGREEFAELAKDLARKIEIGNISLHLNEAVDLEVIDREKPDAVIITTGAKPILPPIPGSTLPNVVQAWDVLSGKTFTGNKVVVVGGGAVGLETALFIAEKGTISGDTLKFLFVNRAEPVETLLELATCGSKDVTLIEMTDKIGRDVGKSTRWGMLQDLARAGIRRFESARVVKITEKTVIFEMGGKQEIIDADTVVIAAGAEPFNPIQADLEEAGIPFIVAGDAKKVALAFDAVHQGFAAGKEI